MRPIIAITMGDPCGIGPEIIVKAFESPGFFDPGCAPVVVGESAAIENAIRMLGSPAVVSPISPKMLGPIRSGTLVEGPGVIPLLAPSEAGAIRLQDSDAIPGRPTPQSSRAAVSSIETAVKLAIEGSVDAVCTCPVNKEQLHSIGFPFPGHTEFIRTLTGAEHVVMMLAAPTLKVALATIHEPLARVPSLIRPDLLRTVIRMTLESMRRDFGTLRPRIAIAGLNPHAGEAGSFGREEIEVIRPVVEEFGGESDCEVTGPWPPDTIFQRAVSGEFHAVVAMYHDQGLIPVKLIGFGMAVNVSLGLPIARTSVDHGTAYDIAGKGLADPGSLKSAAKMAAEIARNRIEFDRKKRAGQ